ncbi:MAG: FUSC family protein [Dermatophilaceae bacterium]|nr:FUSC family protein [Dermatophilaceae bacterium]
MALVLAGRPHAAVSAAFGAFTGLYGADRPYRLRARILAVVAAGFVAAVALGSIGAMVLEQWWWAAAIALVAAVATWGCDAAAIGAPGAWMFLFAFAASTQVPTQPREVVTRSLLACGGAAVAWCVAMVGALVDLRGPERRATANALGSTERVLRLGNDATSRQWHVAQGSLRRAERYAAAAPSAVAGTLLPSLVRAEALLTDAVLAPAESTLAVGADRLAAEGRSLGRSAARWRRSGTRSVVSTSAADGPFEEGRSHDARQSSDPQAERYLPTAVRLLRRQHGRHLAVLRLVGTGRVLLGAGVAAVGAVLLGLGHPYWAPVSAAAVLQATHVRMTWHRSIQRALGTAAGLVLGALLLQVHPGAAVVAVLVVMMQFGVEIFLSRNYAMGILFITPMTMLLSDLAMPSSVSALVMDRSAGVALGIALGLAAALLVAHPRAAATLGHAVERCEVATAWAATATSGAGIRALAELRDALVALRAAEDIARGETWPAGISRADVAATERRAYAVLAAKRRAILG